MGKSAAIAAIGVLAGLILGVFVLSPGAVSNKSSEIATVQDGSEVAKPIRWKMASSYSGNLIVLGTQGHAVEDRIRTLSNGTMELKYFDAGALVPALEVFDAVSTGAVNAGWTGSGYWAGKIPALQFFTAVPFGPSAGEVMAWMYYGGGLELMQELYARHNIFSQPCTLLSPEGSGWFTKEIKTVEDLKGLKMRFFGLGAKVLEKLGVSTQLLAAGDIFPALELGTIDAAEFSMPAIDLDLGFYQVAKHYYFPGWHQPTSMIELMVNLDDWNSLSATQQQIITSVCKESILQTFAQGEAIQFPALQALESKGVTVHRWSPDILDALERAWMEVVEEESEKDADFARVWAALSEFRANYKIWGDLGYLD